MTASPNAAAKTGWALALAQSWQTLPLEMRNEIAGMPATWAMTQALWPELTVDVRRQIAATYETSDVVQVIRANFVAARNQFRANAVASSPALPSSAPAAPADVSEQISRINSSYAATSSMLTSGYNSTISMMAAFGNMSGPRYTVR
jgi:hypothetical protein